MRPARRHQRVVKPRKLAEPGVQLPAQLAGVGDAQRAQRNAGNRNLPRRQPGEGGVAEIGVGDDRRGRRARDFGPDHREDADILGPVGDLDAVEVAGRGRATGPRRAVRRPPRWSDRSGPRRVRVTVNSEATPPAGVSA